MRPAAPVSPCWCANIRPCAQRINPLKHRDRVSGHGVLHGSLPWGCFVIVTFSTMQVAARYRLVSNYWHFVPAAAHRRIDLG